MDTTPSFATCPIASCALRLYLQVDGSVVATPPALAPASAHCNKASQLDCLVQRRLGKLNRTPGLHFRSSCCVKAHRSMDGTTGCGTAALRTTHGKAPRYKQGALVLAKGRKAQKGCSVLPARQPAIMAQRSLTITQHFQALRDMVNTSDTELTDDKAADLFASLDREWQTTRRAKLTTQSFADNLKTFILIRGGIAPSSPDAAPVTDLVQALTRLRIRLLVERGPSYGRTKEDAGQGQPDSQTPITSGEAPSLDESGRQGVFVSTMTVHTPLQTCTGRLAAIRAHSCHHDWSRCTLCSHPVSHGAQGASENWNMSRRGSDRARRWPTLVSLLFERRPTSPPTSPRAQNATAIMKAALNATCFSQTCSTDQYCQAGEGPVKTSPLRGANGPTPDDEAGLAVALKLSRAFTGLQPGNSYVHGVTADLLLGIASWRGEPVTFGSVSMGFHSSQQLLVALHTAQCWGLLP